MSIETDPPSSPIFFIIINRNQSGRLSNFLNYNAITIVVKYDCLFG